MNEENKSIWPSVQQIAFFAAFIVGTTALWGMLSFFAEQRANDRQLTKTVGRHDEKIENLTDSVVSLHKKVSE